MRRFFIPGLAAAVALPAFADFSYYDDVLPGGRAAQMGGAYSALADDPSALHYNPAGLVGVKGSASDSTTTFLTQQTRVKNVLGSSETSFSSRGVSPFIGVAKRLDPDTVGALSVFTPVIMGRDQSFYLGREASDSLRDLDTALKVDGSLMMFSAGFGRRLGMQSSLGVTVSALRLAQATVSSAMFHETRPNGTEGETSRWHRSSFEAYGTDVECGWRQALSPKTTLGAMVGTEHFVFLQYKTESSALLTNAAAPAERTHDKDHGISRGGAFQPKVRIGLAHEAAPDTTVALDLAYYGQRTFTSKEYMVAVVNAHAGIEHRDGDRSARLGIFTNRTGDKQVTLDDESTTRHIDLWGVSAGLGKLRDKSSYGIGLNYQRGDGRMRPLEGGPLVRNARTDAYSFVVTIADR